MNPDEAEFCSKCGNNLKISTVAVNVSSRGEMGTEKDVVLHRIFAVIIDYFVMGFLSFSIVGASIVPGLAAMITDDDNKRFFHEFINYYAPLDILWYIIGNMERPDCW